MLTMNSAESILRSRSSNSVESRPSVRPASKESIESSEASPERSRDSREVEDTWSTVFNEQFVLSGEDLDIVEQLHKTLDPVKDVVERSACQTAACRAVWSHVIHDPLAQFLAGKALIGSLREKLLKDQANKSRELAGVMLAVRTLWFDSLLENSIRRFSSPPQVVLLGAGMDTRAYRLEYLRDCPVFEVDFAKVLNLKDSILNVVGNAVRARPSLHAKHLERVAADLTCKDWCDRLEQCGFNPSRHTVWILEGFLYYLKDSDAKAVLQEISRSSKGDSVLLADVMNESSTNLGKDLETKFYFHSEWPEELMPQLGYTDVKVSQIGDKDANFGLLQDELHIFNQTRKVPRHIMADEAGKPYRRLFLVESFVQKKTQ